MKVVVGRTEEINVSEGSKFLRFVTQDGIVWCPVKTVRSTVYEGVVSRQPPLHELSSDIEDMLSGFDGVPCVLKDSIQISTYRPRYISAYVADVPKIIADEMTSVDFDSLFPSATDSRPTPHKS